MPPQPSQSKPLETLPAGWITKPEACELMQRHVKTFEPLVKKAGIRSQTLANPGKRPTPIYRRSDIEALAQRPRSAGTPANRSTPRIARERLNALATVPLERRHLITQRQAQQLGYPLELLREMKARPQPPGVRYGKRGFRFSVPALFLEMRGIGLLQS